MERRRKEEPSEVITIIAVAIAREARIQLAEKFMIAEGLNE